MVTDATVGSGRNVHTYRYIHIHRHIHIQSAQIGKYLPTHLYMGTQQHNVLSWHYILRL